MPLSSTKPQVSKYSRSTRFFGSPLEGYLSRDDRREEQGDKLTDWLTTLDGEIDAMNVANKGKMEIIYFSLAIIEDGATPHHHHHHHHHHPARLAS